MSNVSANGHARLLPFDHQPRTRVIFGKGTSDQVGQLASEIGARRVLLVTDKGIVAAGHAQSVQQRLESEGIQVTLFDRTLENPTIGCVQDCLEEAKRAAVDCIVGLGGGSAMDTAKGCNFLYTNGGRMQDYWGVGKAVRPMLPLIAIPTTAGTGSECQSAALIVDEQTHQKMACLDPKAAARIAILDPELTLSQPPRVTACTGADAIAHALETAVTRKRNPLSRIYSREAFLLCVQNFPVVVANPADLSARGAMLLGAAIAGLAIENSMLGAAHAAANPLTAHYRIVHGQAVGLVLPAVLRFNMKDNASLLEYASLSLLGGLCESSDAPEMAAEKLATKVEEILDQVGMPESLAACGVEEGKIDFLAEEAARQWTANFNPRALTAADFATLYQTSWRPRTTRVLQPAQARPV